MVLGFPPEMVISSEAPLFVAAGALSDALQAEFPDATFVDGTKDFIKLGD